MPLGAISRNTRPESRSSPYAARSINPATISDAIASARTNPVVMMMIAAIAVAMNANRSVRMCWKLPSTFRLAGWP